MVMTHEIEIAAEGVTGCASEILRAADEIESASQAMAEEILTFGEEHAAALRLKAYLLKA